LAVEIICSLFGVTYRSGDLTLMGGVGREGHKCEAEVRGADLEEHGRLDVPGPAHLHEAHVCDLNDDDAVVDNGDNWVAVLAAALSLGAMPAPPG
jgi:hypothetical protein